MKRGRQPGLVLIWGMTLVFLVGGCTAVAPKEEEAAGTATGPESVAQLEAGTARARVTGIEPEHGNVDSEFVATDLERLGLAPGDYFTVEAVSSGRQLTVFWGTTYADVPRGEGVALVGEEGTIRFARYYEDASAALRVESGDFLLVRLR